MKKFFGFGFLVLRWALFAGLCVLYSFERAGFHPVLFSAAITLNTLAWFVWGLTKGAYLAGAGIVPTPPKILVEGKP